MRLSWVAVPGGVAQLVERYVRNVEVGGSSPLTSTDQDSPLGLGCVETEGPHHGR